MESKPLGLDKLRFQTMENDGVQTFRFGQAAKAEALDSILSNPNLVVVQCG
jgi:hypothetical protein